MGKRFADCLHDETNPLQLDLFMEGLLLTRLTDFKNDVDLSESYVGVVNDLPGGNEQVMWRSICRPVFLKAGYLLQRMDGCITRRSQPSALRSSCLSVFCLCSTSFYVCWETASASQPSMPCSTKTFGPIICPTLCIRFTNEFYARRRTLNAPQAINQHGSLESWGGFWEGLIPADMASSQP